jgi:predicted DNA-binding protein
MTAGHSEHVDRHGLPVDQYSEQQVRQAAAAFARGEVSYDPAAPASAPPAPDVEPMVSRGLRLPVSLDQRVRAAAERAGVPFSTLIREWIELGLTEMDDDRSVPLAALRRAIAHATQTAPAA